MIANQAIDSNGLIDDAFGPNVDRYVHIGETRSFDSATSVDAAGNLTAAALADTVKGAPLMINCAITPTSQVYIVDNNNNNAENYSQYHGPKKLAIKCKCESNNPLVLVDAAIDYEITITIDREANTYCIEGSHDGFPAYEIYINGTRVFEHDPLAPGEGLGALGPPMKHDINIVRQPLP